MGGFELSIGRAAGGQGAAGGQETSQKKFMRQNSQTSRELVYVCVCVCVCVYTGIRMTCRLLFWRADRTINKDKVNRRRKPIKKRVTYVHNLT